MLSFKENKMLYIFAIVVVIFFGGLIKFNYSVDTYILFASNDLEYISEYAGSGRVLTSIFFNILKILNFSPTAMYITSFIIAIICTTFSIYVLYNIFQKYIRNNVLNAIISSLIVINPFIIELWLFIEMGIMMLSILASIIAFKHFDKYLDTKQNKQIGLSLIYMLIALFSYQGTVGIFVALSTISIFINSNKSKEFVKNTIVSFICYGVPTIINFIVVIFAKNDRVATSHDLGKTIDFIIMVSKQQLMTGFGLYPRALFLGLFLSAFALATISIALSQNAFEQKSKNLLKLFYLAFITYFFTVATIIPQEINSVVVFPRNSYPYGSMIGLVFAFMVAYLDKEDEDKYKNYFMILIAIAVIAMEFICFSTIERNRYTVNYNDKQIILEIDNKINEYEKETGNKITNVALYNLEKANKFYPGIDDHINVSAKSERLSSIALMKTYMQRELEEIQGNKETYDKYFKEKNWQDFSLDQVVLEGNTLHWYVY